MSRIQVGRSVSRFEAAHAAWVFTGFLILVVLRPSVSEEFYRTRATIIPTLLLTLAVAGRFFIVSKPASVPRGDPTFILLEIAGGEAAALVVVAGTEPNSVLLALVCGSLAAAFVATGSSP
jgi:hypothetical protein